jgi:hypothetical protein
MLLASPIGGDAEALGASYLAVLRAFSMEDLVKIPCQMSRNRSLNRCPTRQILQRVYEHPSEQWRGSYPPRTTTSRVTLVVLP